MAFLPYNLYQFPPISLKWFNYHFDCLQMYSEMSGNDILAAHKREQHIAKMEAQATAPQERRTAFSTGIRIVSKSVSFGFMYVT